jgi:fumarate reductase (CoM/CoB) subunit B
MGKTAENIIPVGHLYVRDNVVERGCLTGVSESKALWAKDLNLPESADHMLFAACGYQHMKYVEGMMGALRSAEKVGVAMGKVVGISKAFSKVGIDLTSITAKVTASRDDPYTPVLKSAVSVLRKLGLDIGYMHDKEPCCGSPMYYAGFEADYADHARKNYEIFKSAGIRKLIGVVPACTAALKNTYPLYVEGWDVEVKHLLELVAGRLEETRRRPALRQKVTATYHDPCQMSRYLELTEEPRKILNSIEGLELVEPDAEQCGKWSTCCGGGGLETTHPQLSERVGLRRAEELLQTGATLIVSNCPACDMQLIKVMKKMKAHVRVVDLVRLLDEALQ